MRALLHRVRRLDHRLPLARPPHVRLSAARLHGGAPFRVGAVEAIEEAEIAGEGDAAAAEGEDAAAAADEPEG